MGKTTCSAAVALRLASSGQKTLIITSDATPSLSDVYEEEIGDSIREIEKGLDAIEISDHAVLDRWKRRFGPDFHEIVSRLIDVDALDNESRHELLDYIGSAPSLREETMLDLIVDLAETGRYDRIMWDTAPAGETLNLLNMPANLRKHLRSGSRFFEGLDRIGRKIAGKRSVAQIMDEWIAASERISRYIHTRAAFVLVANPEALVVRQVRRVMETLGGYHIVLHGMIINRVIMQPDSASFRTLRKIQEGYLTELIGLAQGLPVATLPFSDTEIRGKKALEEAGKELLISLKL